MLGGIIGGAISAISSGVGMGLQSRQNKLNREHEDKVRKETWERDDNAAQRRVKDLELAGINPLLAAGDPASNTNVAQHSQNAPSTDNLSNSMLSSLKHTDLMAYQKKMQILQENKQDAEIEKIREETEHQRLENKVHDERMESERTNKELTKSQIDKIQQEKEKTSVEIDSIQENTELTKEKKISEIQRRLKESLIEIGSWEIEGGANIAGIKGNANRKKKIYADLNSLSEKIVSGKMTPKEAIEEINRQYQSQDNS